MVTQASWYEFQRQGARHPPRVRSIFHRHRDFIPHDCIRLRALRMGTGFALFRTRMPPGLIDKHLPLLVTIASLSTTSSYFHSLFRVLLTFPSRYLFTIDLLQVFSLRWDIPPISGCTLKQPYSLRATLSGFYWHCALSVKPRTGLSPCFARLSRRIRFLTPCLPGAPHKTTIPSSETDTAPDESVTAALRVGLKAWAFPFSLAVTKGITVVFFSSP